MGIITQLLENYGLIAVGLLIFLEDFGVPLPGETILIAASIAASQGHLSIVAVVLIAFVAAVAGDNVGWFIGRYGGRRAIYAIACRSRIRGHYLLAPSTVRRGEHFFSRYGAWVIIFARFFDVFRQINGLIAGSLGTPWLRFLPYNMIGAGLWVGVWASVGYFVGSAAGETRLERLLLYVVIGTFVLISLAYVTRHLVRRVRHEPPRRVSSEQEAAICREERGLPTRVDVGGDPTREVGSAPTRTPREQG